MNKKYVVLIAVVLLIVIGGMLWFKGTQDKTAIKKDTISYLTEEGYDINKDIKDISIVKFEEGNGINKVKVIFKDEPEVEYFFSYEQDSKRIILTDIDSPESHEENHFR